MPETIYMRVGETGTFSYLIAEYDSLTQSIIPVDLTDSVVTYDVFKEVQQADGTFLDVAFATGLSCSFATGSTGYVDAPLPEVDAAGLYKALFNVISDETTKIYPRYEDQFISALNVESVSRSDEGVVTELPSAPVCGDTVYYDGLQWIFIGAGNAGDTLGVDADTQLPAWVTPE